MIALLISFYNGSFGGRFGGNVFKNPARYILHIINHVNFLSFDHDDTEPSKSQVSFISLIFGLK